jgi:probable rRNA maturation factor
MNYKFRKQKKSTDVLTFVSELNIKKKYKAKICNIFLSAETIKRDAHINKINFYTHLTHLLIHSFLHINGFTHKKKQDYDKMKNIEIKILKKLGISNPYLYN